MWNSLDVTRNSLSTFIANTFAFQTVKKTPKAVLYFVLFTAAVIASRKVVLMRRKRKHLEYSKKKKDVVILHHFPKTVVGIPSLSPFVLKLETYLRMAKIPYENDFTGWTGGPKGKFPYITLNGMEMGDSQLIIEYLNEKYNINLSSNLSNEQKAIARALRIMAEDHFFWCLALYRWSFDNDRNIIKTSSQPCLFRLVFPIIQRVIKRQSWYQGIGRHTKSEVMDMARNDMLALSIYLGNKKFFMGNEPSEVDCALFGFLAQLLYTPMPEFEKLINEDMKNIKEYCKRMKERFWTDWK